jgi:hypothetical protein
MKKTILILSVTTLTVAFGATAFFMGTGKSKQIQNDPTPKFTTASLQTIEKEQSQVSVPTDTIKAKNQVMRLTVLLMTVHINNTLIC